MNDPRIRALAQDAAVKIKQLSEGKECEIEAIYKDFRTKADAIQAEASADELDSPSADPLPVTDKTID